MRLMTCQALSISPCLELERDGSVRIRRHALPCALEQRHLLEPER